MFESEADRLARIKSLGGELFDVGRPAQIWAVFDREFLSADIGTQSAENRKPVLTCRTSDVDGLIKEVVVRRVSDDTQYTIRRFEHDGTGMTLVVLKA